MSDSYKDAVYAAVTREAAMTASEALEFLHKYLDPDGKVPWHSCYYSTCYPVADANCETGVKLALAMAVLRKAVQHHTHLRNNVVIPVDNPLGLTADELAAQVRRHLNDLGPGGTPQ